MASLPPAIVAEAMLAAAQGVYAEKVADRARVGGWLRTAAHGAQLGTQGATPGRRR